MFKKLTLAAGVLIAAATLAPTTAASAHGYHGARYVPVYVHRNRHYRPRYARRHYVRAYPGRPYYGRGYCHDRGTGGAIVGAIAGGLLGAEIADGGRYHRGDEVAGAIIGSGVGALAGRAIDRDC
ncbi:MAG: glycine zipper 2TM domain-containing protein [Sphingomonadaceae bacterium]|nr:glycine zipper 2TM domain-containing protein [Sphingomonadaceae bacterium]